jgi:hypothetical protein
MEGLPERNMQSHPFPTLGLRRSAKQTIDCMGQGGEDMAQTN